MADLNEKLLNINSAFEKFNSQTATGPSWNLSLAIEEYEAALREHIQEITKDQVRVIIDKLKSNSDLTEGDLDYIKLWLVGDAQYYVKLENNYQEWVEELSRLMKDINQRNNANPDFEQSSHTRALLLDAMRVLADIMFFLKQKERIQNFSESTKEIDPQERDLIIRLLEGKIRSPKE